MLLIALIAAATALAAHFGGSAPLAALLGRHDAQAAQPAALGLAAPAGHRGIAAHHADVRAGLGGGRQGRLEPRCRRAWSLALVLARGVAKVLGVGARQLGQRHELAPGFLDRLRHVADVVGRAAAGVAIRRFVAHAGAAHRQHRAAGHPADGGAWRHPRHLRDLPRRRELHALGDRRRRPTPCRESCVDKRLQVPRAASPPNRSPLEPFQQVGGAVAGRGAGAAAGQHARLRPGALLRRDAAADGQVFRCRARWCRR